ncbi:MAG: hypothetical protein Q9187_007132 [Circinaria calcarea]
MADALCGPSNALQNIHKHASVDRTLQQDRLANRQLPAQGFRSSAESNVGILDAEFESFQAGFLPRGDLHQSPFHDGTSAHFASPPHIQQEVPGWASDFQQLNLNEVRSSPISPSQFRHAAPLQRTIPGDWHQEFLHQQNASFHQQSHAPRGYGGMIWQQRQSQLPEFYNLNPPTSSMAQQNRPENAVDDTFDEVAFEKAFDAARMEIMDAEPKGMDSPADLGQTISAYARTLEIQENIQSFQPRDGDLVVGDINNPDLDNFDFDAFLQNSTDLGHNSGETTSEQSDRQGEADADELAKTAGQLLDSLKDERSQKFQQSNFLALMRQLRDKEVRVEGDKMVDVNVDVSILLFWLMMKHHRVVHANFITCQVTQYDVQTG